MSIKAVTLDSNKRKGDIAINGKIQNLTLLKRAITGRLKAGNDLFKAPELYCI